ncbi:dTMP kinase [Actinoplanes sp. CA-030573]|uniref:dTMP kinase n=1 Tax=Actinoplanes sp. CA-030573 TaxID=3239898 RepID=UPI003D8B252B
MTTQFIAIEGPRSVGKRKVAELLANRLAAIGDIGVHLTGEPTRTPLGQLILRQEAMLYGRSLALAVAADRAAHVETEIIPQLDDGRHVVTARYVPSSLVLQRIDGLDLDEIWSYNRYVLPATVIYLEDDPAAIRERLGQRATLSRLEASGSPERELALYRDAKEFLDQEEWKQHIINCAGRTPDQVVGDILGALISPVQ